MVDASVTIDEIAKLCGVKPPVVRRWIEHGELAAVPQDRQHVRVRSSDLETIVVACARARAEEARNGYKPGGGAEVGPRLERAPSRRAYREEPPASLAHNKETLPIIADEEEALPTIPDGEEALPTIADSDEAPVSIAGSDETSLSIADGDDITLINRVFFHPDGRWRWTMFFVWPLLWLVAVVASVELGPLLR